MSLKLNTPCDIDGICPYDAEYSHDCEYWCGQDEPEDRWECEPSRDDWDEDQ